MTSDARGASALIARIAAVIQGVDLDCACRDRVREALTRFERLERGRRARRALAGARDQRERIAGLLALLAELDEIGWEEADASVYPELADLFGDIAEAARAGAASMRLLGRSGPQEP